MSVVHDILIDEYERLLRFVNKLSEELQNYPKGSIQEKPRGNQFFCYLAFRKENKVIFKYLGRKGSEKVIELKNKIEERKKIEIRLKKAKASIKELERVLNARKLKNSI